MKKAVINYQKTTGIARKEQIYEKIARLDSEPLITQIYKDNYEKAVYGN